LVTVTGWDPVLVNPTEFDDWLLGGTPPKLIPLVVAESVPAGFCPTPERVICAVPDPVVTVTPPPFGPAAVGLKVTGTVIVPPEESVVGNEVLGEPNVNGPLTESELTVTVPVALRVRVWVDDWPTVVAGKVGEDPPMGGPTGEPNPMTFPSRVPT
jgi:hypothetical protein